METNIVRVCGFLKQVSNEKEPKLEDLYDTEIFKLLRTYFKDGSNYHSVFDEISNLMKENKIKSNSLTIFMAEITKSENYYPDKPKEVKLK